MNANGQTQTQYCLVAQQMLPVKEGTLEVMNVICLKKAILIQSSRLVKTDNSLVLLACTTCHKLKQVKKCHKQSGTVFQVRF